MNNNIIDIAFIAAKIASIKDEKARMMVGGAMTIIFINRCVQWN